MSADLTPEQAFAEALAAFQKDLPSVGKTSKADTGKYGYTYAPLDVVAATVMPLLAANGLAYTACPTLTDTGHFCLRYALVHVGGHREEGLYPLPDPERVNPQQIGSAITYARRYCLMSATGVAPADEDDDGAKAVEGHAADGDHSSSRTRRSRPAEPQVDEWTTSDPEWVADFERRLTACTTADEARAMDAEARDAYSAKRITPDDAKRLKQQIDERLQELTGELAVSA